MLHHRDYCVDDDDWHCDLVLVVTVAMLPSQHSFHVVIEALASHAVLPVMHHVACLVAATHWVLNTD